MRIGPLRMTGSDVSHVTVSDVSHVTGTGSVFCACATGSCAIVSVVGAPEVTSVTYPEEAMTGSDRVRLRNRKLRNRFPRFFLLTVVQIPWMFPAFFLTLVVVQNVPLRMTGSTRATGSDKR